MTRLLPWLRVRLRAWWDLFAAQFAKFGVIGTIGIFIDLGAYWLLTAGLGDGGVLAGREKIASVLATGIATAVSWIANRYWTFRDHRSARVPRELFLFLVFNGVGALITVGCVVVAVDVLGITDPMGQNVARLFGIGVGTIFRFWTYRQFVFVRELSDLPPVPTEETLRDTNSRA
ncbi:putative flippase GtrA [Kineosphaera limosa]|uniref:GtrA/DPMS transmembrane domain-containing protein n=1 Tax=Kineosphaera limosa NBRC 100340 TaxID=1184609 RepID=K6WF76_9MICO|nr:GtrA family protein [Kineosphaera limosa]NYE01872.1 putative flippase GtrA [Kineosphaera limosa]GAB97945.1 hypothetical protein KILIM_089_00150 [Kineosphaera limosa NBRC 100340]